MNVDTTFVSTIQSVVLTADVFQLYIKKKYLPNIIKVKIHLAVGSNILSKLIFASCVSYSDRAYDITGCVSSLYNKKILVNFIFKKIPKINRKIVIPYFAIPPVGKTAIFDKKRLHSASSSEGRAQLRHNATLEPASTLLTYFLKLKMCSPSTIHIHT